MDAHARRHASSAHSGSAQRPLGATSAPTRPPEAPTRPPEAARNHTNAIRHFLREIQNMLFLYLNYYRDPIRDEFVMNS